VATEDLGTSLTGTYTIHGGTAHLYERSVVVNGAAGDIAVRFRFPMIGRPHIPRVASTTLDASAVTFQPGGYQPQTIRELVRAALAERQLYDIVDSFRPACTTGTIASAASSAAQLPARHRRPRRHPGHRDLYDYQLEDDDDAGGFGNALFLRNLVLGQAPGPEFPDVEELQLIQPRHAM
jgi:hypothetical protein